MTIKAARLLVAPILLSSFFSCTSTPTVREGNISIRKRHFFDSRLGEAHGIASPFLLRDKVALLYGESGDVELFSPEGEYLRGFNVMDSTRQMISVPCGITSFEDELVVMDCHYETMTFFSQEGHYIDQLDLRPTLNQYNVCFSYAMFLNTAFQQDAGEDLFFPVQYIDTIHSGTKFLYKGIIGRLTPERKLGDLLGSFPKTYSQKKWGATAWYFFARNGNEMFISFESVPDILVFDLKGEVLRSFGQAPEGWMPPDECPTMEAYMDLYPVLRNGSFLFQHLYHNPETGDVYRTICLPTTDMSKGEMPLQDRQKVLQHYNSRGQLVGTYQLPQGVLYLRDFLPGQEVTAIGYDSESRKFTFLTLQFPEA